MKGEAWRIIIWRSSAILITGRRIASVKDLKIFVQQNWHSADIFFSTSQDIERSVLTTWRE